MLNGSVILFALLTTCLLAIGLTSAEILDTKERKSDPENWWNRVTLFSDDHRRDLRGEKNDFWAVRGKRSAKESDMIDWKHPEVEDLEIPEYLQDLLARIIYELLQDYDIDEITEDVIEDKLNEMTFGSSSVGMVKRAGGMMKPNSLFSSYMKTKKAGYKPNGLFQTIPGKKSSLKPNGLFGSIHGKRVIKPNGLFSQLGKRGGGLLKPNGLFSVHGKRSDVEEAKRAILLKPNGLFVPTKRFMKPNGLFNAFKRELMTSQHHPMMYHSMEYSPIEADGETEMEDVADADDWTEMAVNGVHHHPMATVYDANNELSSQHSTDELMHKRDESFWAARGKRAKDDFWAVRGKRDNKDDDFWAVRGKRSPELANVATTNMVA